MLGIFILPNRQVLRYCSLLLGSKQLSERPLSGMSRLCDVELAGLAVSLGFSSQQPFGRQSQLAFVKGSLRALEAATSRRKFSGCCR